MRGTRALRSVLLVAVMMVQPVRANATVPMDPQYLPEAGLLLAATFTAAMALYRLYTRQLRGALQAGAVSLACIALALVLLANCHKPSGPFVIVPAAENSMTLVLGDAVLYVPLADRYLLSANGVRFLVLDLQGAGLAVSCIVGTQNKASTGIHRNAISFNRSGIRSSKPDTHTFLVEEEGKDLLRVHMPEPLRIEVTGEFYERRSSEPVLITLRNGISWRDGDVPPRTVVDLRSQGKGPIDFGHSGTIRVLPR